MQSYKNILEAAAAIVISQIVCLCTQPNPKWYYPTICGYYNHRGQNNISGGGNMCEKWCCSKNNFQMDWLLLCNRKEKVP